MVGIIISVCLAALVLAGLIVFICKSRSKSSNNVKTNKEGKKTVTKENSKNKTVVVEKEQNKVKEQATNVVKEEKTVVDGKEQNKEKEVGQGKTVVGKVESKTYEENMKKDLGTEINSAIDYLADVRGFGTKEDMIAIFKNFKNVDAKTQDAYLKGLEGVINANKSFLDSGFDMKKYGLSYDEKLKNLNSLKQYLLNNK